MKKEFLLTLIVAFFTFSCSEEKPRPSRIVMERDELSQCPYCQGSGMVAGPYGSYRCQQCNGSGVRYNVSFHGGTLKQTNASCNQCSCDGYKGYKHSNGTYEGPCKNTDDYGHTCNHSPEDHGLQSW